MKLKSVYVCCECGYETSKWLGKCPDCGSFNTMNEEVRSDAPEKSDRRAGVTATAYKLSDVDPNSQPRTKTGIGELDRALGGGIVAGSLILIGGDPGIGKSTILLQMCGNLANKLKIYYFSGEESVNQIKIRADRLGLPCTDITVFNETDASAILDAIESAKPDLVVVDSIQTVSHPSVSSYAGSISQVRECTNMLMRAAKTSGIPIFLVGHVNKDGAIAGPKVMEHIVDVVLYFEGERNLNYRILRTTKNRFGSTNEIGVFEMTDHGLDEVENPSAALLSGRPSNVSGSCIACQVDGSRPILTEVQALVSKAGYGNARRMSAGFDYNRCIMMIAVLEKRCGLRFGEFDTYLNVVGGLRLDEPASDLPICLSLASGLLDKPLGEDIVAFGEIGLAGEIRSVSSASVRLSEAARLGFKRCVVPQKTYNSIKNSCPDSIELIPVQSLFSCLKILFK